jgi:hypothetical protein
MHGTMTAAGKDVEATTPHFEMRVGKKRWLARTAVKASPTRSRRPSKREEAAEQAED